MKILIVDDHPIVRAGVKRLLAGERDLVIEEAANGHEALEAVRASPRDLVILDLNLPGIGGFDMVARLIREEKRPRILVLSMHDDPIFAMRALEAGADGYVSKNAPPTQIIEAIARLRKGQTYLAPELAQEVAMWNVRAPNHPLKDLSRRELEILRLLGDGNGISQIADTLGLGYKTVANNLSQIKVKLGVKRTAELVRIAVENRDAVSPGR
jgi:two-component system, NarL family, invasion response regulator UvrY